MSKRSLIRADDIGSLMLYILAYRPDELGVVPDHDGFLTFKELLQAIHEEGWGYVRQGHINEVLAGKYRSLFEFDEDRIRAKERLWNLDLETPSASIPKILYVGVRRKAHPHVLEKGLRGEKLFTLTPDRDMALRIGRRRDQKPVLIEVMTGPAREQGILFYPFGQLFLTSEVPFQCLSGPPVAEGIREEREAREAKKEKPVSAPVEFSAGTFVLDAFRDPDRHRQFKGKKQRTWKEASRKLRRRKG